MMTLFRPRGSRAQAGSSGRRGRNTIVKIIAVSLAAAGAAALSVAPAGAATNTDPTATISRSIFLAASGGGVADVPTTGPRSIQLAQGTYTFGYTLSVGGANATTVQDSRSIFLAKGTYLWYCAMKGTAGAYPNDNYLVQCTLIPSSFNGVAASVPNNATGDAWALPKGTYSWTGYLTPHF